MELESLIGIHVDLLTPGDLPPKFRAKTTRLKMAIGGLGGQNSCAIKCEFILSRTLTGLNRRIEMENSRWFMRLAAGACFLVGLTACHGKNLPKPQMHYLDNGQLRVGVNLAMGGAIIYLAQIRTKMNLVNHADLGREIQMSDYSGPVPYIPPGRQILPYWSGLGWNPVQAGDTFKNPSKVVYFKNNGHSMVVRCVPMIWPLNNVPARCTFQTHITLHGNTVHVRCTMELFRKDLKQYPARLQECPAIYTIGKLWRLVSYTGGKPFTNAAVTMLDPPTVLAREMQVFSGQRKGDPWVPFNPTENWAALVNNRGFGLGIWAPKDYEFNGGFYGAPHQGTGGITDGQTGYIGPNFWDIIDHNITYKYHYVLIVGSIKQIRHWVYSHAPRITAPQWTFTGNRQHWRYVNATDTGWPIKGHLDVLLSRAHPEIISPCCFWQASAAPVLYIKAAFKPPEKTCAVWWRAFGTVFSRRSCIVFPVKADGRYHQYSIKLAGLKTYHGPMAQLRIDPIIRGRTNAWVKICSVGFAR